MARQPATSFSIHFTIPSTAPLAHIKRSAEIRMDDAEYRVSVGDRIHRAAVIVAATSITALFIYSLGFGRGIKGSALVLWPTIAIWFADDLAFHVSQGSSGWINPIQAPKILRWTAWFSISCLLFLGWASLTNRDAKRKIRNAEQMDINRLAAPQRRTKSSQ